MKICLLLLINHKEKNSVVISTHALGQRHKETAAADILPKVLERSTLLRPAIASAISHLLPCKLPFDR